MLPTSLYNDRIEAGCDEAGRGCLAGPVVAAAVVLPCGFSHPLLVDSKRLTEAQRLEARQIIIDNAAAWSVGWSSPQTIDNINILNASILAMHRALDGLDVVPQHISVDGNRFKPWRFTPYTTVVKGDSRLADIAAASILAKTTRDAFMELLHRELPCYGFDRHKGYPTGAHYAALKAVGPSPWHRFSFKLGTENQGLSALKASLKNNR